MTGFNRKRLLPNEWEMFPGPTIGVAKRAVIRCHQSCSANHGPFGIARSDENRLSLTEPQHKGRVVLTPEMPPEIDSEIISAAAGWLAVANHFRRWVCREISAASPMERENLRGDYLFVIDGEPRFIVFVGADWNGSAQFGADGQLLYDDSVPIRLDAQAIQNLIATSHRVRISASTAILQRLLLGTMRARIAYLSGQVQIDGDLPGFLRLVSLLKARGVKPASSAVFSSADVLGASASVKGERS